MSHALNEVQTEYIEGAIYAVGTEKDPICFTINDTTGFATDSINDGGWGGICFHNGLGGMNGNMSDNDTSEIIHCIIEYAKDFDIHTLQGGAIKAKYFSRLVIKNCTIRHNFAYSGGGIGLMEVQIMTILWLLDKLWMEDIS